MSDIRSALKAIEERHGGRLTPDAVVDDAAKSDSPLHDLFEWDDARAGHQFRLEQARSLIRSVRVIVKTETRQLSTVYYVRDPTLPQTEQGYVSIARLRDDADMARESLELEFGRAHAAMSRAKSLSEALGLAAEVDAILVGIDAVRWQIKRKPRDDDSHGVSV